MVMYALTGKFIWIPFYLFLLYLVIKQYKVRSIDVVIAIALVITASDMLSVHAFKEVFQRLRPCQDPELKNLIHLVNGKCGGLYGFVSSHAANTFALSLFVIQLLAKKVRYLIPVMLFWAALVSYTRIYLGVHFPLDVFCGALLGVSIGFSVGKLFNWYYNRFVLRTSSRI